MAIVITWKPVLQALMLRDYHADYGDEKIMVCVNPQPVFWRERSDLLSDYARQLGDVNLLKSKAEIATGDAAIEAGQKYTEAFTNFINWGETTFVPGMHAWFAKLWSFGGEQYTAADLDQYQEIDPHFASWAKARSIEMIDAHASARKKV
jgi:hypothetical protein